MACMGTDIRTWCLREKVSRNDNDNSHPPAPALSLTVSPEYVQTVILPRYPADYTVPPSLCDDTTQRRPFSLPTPMPPAPSACPTSFDHVHVPCDIDVRRVWLLVSVSPWPKRHLRRHRHVFACDQSYQLEDNFTLTRALELHLTSPMRALIALWHLHQPIPPIAAPTN